MANWTEVTIRFVQMYGPVALFVFTFLETSMLFPFLPSEAVVPAAAAVIVSGPTSLAAFVLAATVGGTMGAFVPFYVFRGGRVGGADWIRDRIAVSSERVERGEEWFRRWGKSSVLWGRFLPTLRSVVSIPAGLVDMDPTRFGAYTAVGTAGFYAVAGAVVYYGQQRSIFAAAFDVATDDPTLTAVVILALLGIGLFVRRWVRCRNTEN